MYGGQLRKHPVITNKGSVLGATFSALLAGLAMLTAACPSQSPNSGMMGMGMNSDMKKMMRDMMGGTLPPGVAAKDLPDPESDGARLVSHFCAQCHDLPSPAMHTAEEWTLIAKRMFKRMSMMSGMGGMGGMGRMGNMMGIDAPSEDERGTIVTYLRSHSLKPYGPNLIPESGTAGAALFSRTCSQCHALPDPWLHNAGEWGGVVERMRLNMETMGKQGITDKEAGEIASFLSRNARK